MTVLRIPCIAQPQEFDIALGVTTYRATLKWNSVSNVWILDLGLPGGALVVGGIPLVTGADLLAQYGHLGFTGKLIAQTDFDLTAPPTFDNLGTAGNLYFITD